MSATCQLRCSVHMKSSHVRTQNSHAKTARVDLAVKRRLERVRVSIRVFYAKYSANSLRTSALRTHPPPPPLVGPTNLQILATPLPILYAKVYPCYINIYSQAQSATGTLSGLVFYANIVGVNHNIFLPVKTNNPYSVFIAWLNLDFGIDTCFYNGMDTYTKT